MDYFHRAFLCDAMDGWASALAKKPNISWEDVCELVGECATFEVEVPTPFPCVFEIKHQRVVLALIRFLALSGGKFQDELVPFLCHYFEHVLKFNWSSNVSQAADEVYSDSFMYSFTKRMFLCQGLNKNSCQMLSHAMLRFLDHGVAVIKSTKPEDEMKKPVILHLIYGFLKALCDPAVDTIAVPLIPIADMLSELMTNSYESFEGAQVTDNLDPNYSNLSPQYPSVEEDALKILIAKSMVRLMLQGSSAKFSKFMDAWATDAALPRILVTDGGLMKVADSYLNTFWTPARRYLTQCSSLTDASLAESHLMIIAVASQITAKLPHEFGDVIREALENHRFLHEICVPIFSAVQCVLTCNSSLAQYALMFLEDATFRDIFENVPNVGNEGEIVKKNYAFTYVLTCKMSDSYFDTSAAILRQINNICSTNSEDEQTVLLDLCIIDKLAENASEKDNVADMIPLLVGCFDKFCNSPKITSLLLRTLVSITIATNGVEIAEVLDAMATSFKHVAHDIDLKDEIGKQFIRMAASDHSSEGLKEKVLERLMILFVELATIRRLELEKETEKDDSKAAILLEQNERSIIKLISLITEISVMLASKKEIFTKHEFVSLFRKVWAISVSRGLNTDSTWKDEWYSSVCMLAEVTPLLSSGSSSRLSISEIRTDLSNIAKSEDPVHINPTKNNGLLETARAIVPSSNSMKLFAAIVFHIDKLLMRRKKTPLIYNYLIEFSDSDVREDLKRVAHEFINFVIAEVTYNESIPKLVCQLIIKFPCFHRKLTEYILGNIARLIEHFENVLREPTVVEYVFEMLQILSKAADDNYLEKIVYTYRLNLHTTVEIIEIPQGYKFRQWLYSVYREFWQNIYISASKVSSGEITALLQNYIMTSKNYEDNVTGHAGFSLAVEIGISKHGCNDLSGISVNPLSFHSAQLTNTARFFDMFSQRTFDTGSTKSLNRHFDSVSNGASGSAQLESSVKQELKLLVNAAVKKSHVESKRFYETFSKAASVIIQSQKLDRELLYLLVSVPVQHFTESSLMAGVDAWNWLVASRPDLKIQFMTVQVEIWEWCVRRKRGIFSQKYSVADPFTKKMIYGPSKRPKEIDGSISYFLPHLIWIQFLMSHYDGNRKWKPDFNTQYLRLMEITLTNFDSPSNHPICGLCYLRLWTLFQKIFNDFEKNCTGADNFRKLWLKYENYSMLLHVVAMHNSWNAYDSKFVAGDISVLLNIFKTVKTDDSTEFAGKAKDEVITDFDSKKTVSMQFYTDRLRKIQKMTLTVIELELHRLFVWYNPLKNSKYDVFDDSEFRVRKQLSKKFCRDFIKDAWKISPHLAILLSQRGSLRGSKDVLTELVLSNPFVCIKYSDSVEFVVNQQSVSKDVEALRYALFWPPVNPINAISYFLPTFKLHPYIIQYAAKSLECFPAELVFFYVPQIVQSIRYDILGYTEQFIINTSNISPLFAHQIIWNIKANVYEFETIKEKEADIKIPPKEEDMAIVNDPVAPVFEKVMIRIVASFEGDDMEFYSREFEFFTKVTKISGALKPYIRKTKQEKKQKIEEELRRIQVETGVYLPSNPDSIVIDIDYKSGRPLQSHAKAPFMATFKIKKTSSDVKTLTRKKERQSSYESLYLRDDQEDDVHSDASNDDEFMSQSAIFKVGDDCRQDVLALQLIAIFNNIYGHIGLDTWLYPYRIVATGWGSGVIEVVPNSVSRDQMGRSNINNLYEWFLATYGEETGIRFQKARDSFTKSLAAYSVILYLLQIKDRHNGNMLIDRDGHVVHIDFGFIFDIVPGGVKFELSPFKLTKEMLQVIEAGSNSSIAYENFVVYCVKAFLAIRPHAEEIIQMVGLMLDSKLPCIKGDLTISNLRDRFQMDLSEKMAVDYMTKLVNSSYQAWSTIVYDGYQMLTNGIPF